MIRYDLATNHLTTEIGKIDPRWLAKAKTRTAKFVGLGRFDEKSSIWSTIKPVYIRLQENKCVFCERQFENPDYGTIEYDLEHFRPKSAISGWPDSTRHPSLRYSFATGAAAAVGYYWLSYDPANYAASCKVCNTIFKLNYFPIAGPRGQHTAGPAGLAAEKPFLCYPIGSDDTDPERLITFIATTAIPRAKRGHDRRRGQIIIDFFGINEREQLHRERARMICLSGSAWQSRANGTESPSDTMVIERLRLPGHPHANCLRAFERLWTEDPTLAAKVYDRSRNYATSAPGTMPPDV